MIESAIISNEYTDFLSTLSKEELKKFTEFLDSPLFNKNPAQKKLLFELKKYYPKFISKNYSKENLFKKIYPGKAFTEKRFNNLISEGIKLSNVFLKVCPVLKNHFRTELALMDELNMRGLNKNFLRISKKTNERYYNESVYSSKFNDLYLFEVSALRYELKKKTRESYKSVKKVQDLWLLSFLNFAFYDIEELLNKNNSDSSLTLDVIKQIDLESIVDYVAENYPELSDIYALCYYRMMCLINLSNNEYYFKLKNVFLKLHSKMTFPMLTASLRRLNNLCLVKLERLDMNEFSKELFEIHKLTLELNAFLEGRFNKVFQVNLFHSIINSALMNNEDEWLYEFINKYIVYVEKKFRDEYYNLGMLYYFFTKKDFDKCYEHLNKIKFKDINLKTGVRNVLLMLYYETKNYETAFYLIHSFEKLIKRNDELPQDFILFENLFISSYSDLLKFKTGNKNIDIGYSFNRIKNKFYGEFKWLHEKYEELNTKNPI